MSDKKQREGISKSLKRFYGVGDFGFTLMTNIDTFYATYFFTNIAQFSLGIVTIITTISAIFDAVLSCVYGAWLNKIKPHKWGRYRSWLILTPWLVPILYAMQFVKIDNGVFGLIFMTVAMITSRIAWNIPFIANISMINVAGKTTDERMSLSSIRMVWTSAASVVYSYVGPAVVAVFAALLGESNAYAATAFSFGILMAAGFYAHFKMFEGYEEPGEEEIARLKKESQKQVKVKAWDAIKCNPHLIWLIFSSTTKYMVLFLVNGIAIYYFTYVSKDPGLMITFVFAVNLLGVLASYVSKFVVAKLTAKKAVIISYSLMAVAMILAYFIYQQTWLVIGIMCFVFFLLTMTNACDTELFATCSVFSSIKTGHDTTGTIMGLLTVPVKVGVIMRGILISVSLSIAGFNASIDPAAASVAMQKGISLGFMVIPGITIALGALFLAFGYRLTNEQLEAMKLEK